MGKRRNREIIQYKYACTITGESFTRTKKAAHEDELISIKAYYELNPEKDDRPETLKLKLANSQGPVQLEESVKSEDITSADGNSDDSTK